MNKFDKSAAQITLVAFVLIGQLTVAGCPQNQSSAEIVPPSQMTQSELTGPETKMPISGQQKEPSGQSNKYPLGSAASEVKDARRIQSQSTVGIQGIHPAKAPLSSVISANAEMVIDKEEVLIGGLRGLSIEARNNTDRPLIFYGDKAVATINGAHLAAAPLIVLDNIAAPVKNRRQIVKGEIRDSVLAGGTIGGIPTALDEMRQEGPVLGRYGHDELRREDEISRFGKRIVWPGNSTKGVIYFASIAPITGAVIELPVSSLYDTTDSASITRAR
jgi:hypothetical protein